MSDELHRRNRQAQLPDHPDRGCDLHDSCPTVELTSQHSSPGSDKMVVSTPPVLIENPTRGVPSTRPSLPDRVASTTISIPGRGGFSMPRKALDITGQRFNRLLVVKRDQSRPKPPTWICRCDCGATTSVTTAHLVEQRTQSCGYLKRERQVTHGRSKTRVYRIWNGMRERCENPHNKRWADYGGRGITVCERWRTFANFYADMGEPPLDASIERIDNNGSYEPGNCRWAGRKEQQRNRRGLRLVTYQGETLSLVEWSERLGLPYGRLQTRMVRGWSAERAFTTEYARAW